MTTKEKLFKVLKSLHLNASYDEDNDIKITYQMKDIYFIVNEEADSSYVCVNLFNIASVEEEDLISALMICNKITREIKVINLHLDDSLKVINCSYEFYFSSLASIKQNVEHALNIMRVISTIYKERMQELDEA